MKFITCPPSKTRSVFDKMKSIFSKYYRYLREKKPPKFEYKIYNSKKINFQKKCSCERCLRNFALLAPLVCVIWLAHSNFQPCNRAPSRAKGLKCPPPRDIEFYQKRLNKRINQREMIFKNQLLLKKNSRCVIVAMHRLYCMFDRDLPNCFKTNKITRSVYL